MIGSPLFLVAPDTTKNRSRQRLENAITQAQTDVGKKTCFVLVLLVSFYSVTVADGRVPIRVKGSTDMAGYVDLLAKDYETEHPDVSVVVSGGGTTCGMDGLFDKTVEVVMASFPLTAGQKRLATERGVLIRERFFGWQGIAVFVHPENGVSTLTLDEMRNIFTGKVTSWMQVMGSNKPPTVYIGEHPSAAAYKYVQEYVLHEAPFKKDALVRRYYRNIVKAVASDRYGIGVAPLLKVEYVGRDHPVKMIGVKKDKITPPVFPDRTSVENRSYPLIRPLYLYTGAKSAKNRLVADFVEYCAVHGLVGKWKLPEDER